MSHVKIGHSPWINKFANITSTGIQNSAKYSKSNLTLNSHHFFMYVHQKTSQGLIHYFHIHNIFLRLCHLRFHIPKINYNLLSVLLFWSLLTKKNHSLTEYCYSHLTRSHYPPKNYSRRYPHYNQLKYVHNIQFYVGCLSILRKS